jgi:hypothetical protein
MPTGIPDRLTFNAPPAGYLDRPWSFWRCRRHWRPGIHLRPGGPPSTASTRSPTRRWASTMRHVETSLACAAREASMVPPSGTRFHQAARGSTKRHERKSVLGLNVVDGCILSDLGSGTTAEIEEELRLHYVAMSPPRAAYILSCRSGSSRTSNPPPGSSCLYSPYSIRAIFPVACSLAS